MNHHFDLFEEAILVVDKTGFIIKPPNRSAYVTFPDWFGKVIGEGWQKNISTLLCETKRDRESFECNFEQLTEDIIPFQVAAAMLPREVAHGEQHYLIDYRSGSMESGEPEVLVMISPREKFETMLARGGGNHMDFVKAVLEDIDVSKGFLRETNDLVLNINETYEPERLAKVLHTIKGNCGCFGMKDIATHVHQTEDFLIEGETRIAFDRIEQLKKIWSEKINLFANLLVDENNQIVITKTEFEDLSMDLMSNRDWSEILGVVQKWSMELVDVRFKRLELQLKRFAADANKEVKTVFSGTGTRFPRKGLEGMWGSLVHLLRNIIDHGIEDVGTRTNAGKAPSATVTFGVLMLEDDAIVFIKDDGGGIHWQKLAEKAKLRGLPNGTRSDLVAALFAPGVSTKDNVSLTAGRGVGLSAVLEEVQKLEGSILVESAEGKGTEFRMKIPLATLANLQLTAQ